ncbi:hypothetical protein VNI00_013478 [Paramarasmius palmivorus]|uniref:Uncharacterized protein n=1 Tax=Paramarasmius palmivorus TaxID=297713 RepID=A0AAW0C0V4_9AGAR
MPPYSPQYLRTTTRNAPYPSLRTRYSSEPDSNLEEVARTLSAPSHRHVQHSQARYQPEPGSASYSTAVVGPTPTNSHADDPDSDLENVVRRVSTPVHRHVTHSSHRVSSTEPDSDLEDVARSVPTIHRHVPSSCYPEQDREAISEKVDHAPSLSSHNHLSKAANSTSASTSNRPRSLGRLVAANAQASQGQSEQDEETCLDFHEDIAGIAKDDDSKSISSQLSESSASDYKDKEFLILKPPGEVGRPNNGGYTLKSALKWPDSDYRDVHNFVKKQVPKVLDCRIPFSGQQKDKVLVVRAKVSNLWYWRTY